eukprot:3231140-Rhodomonas_salina.1
MELGGEVREEESKGKRAPLHDRRGLEPLVEEAESSVMRAALVHGDYPAATTTPVSGPTQASRYAKTHH